MNGAVAEVHPPLAPVRAPAPNAGHRERLRERALNGGLSALPDYELLELYLFRTIGRRDVKAVAKALLARFGGVQATRSLPRWTSCSRLRALAKRPRWTSSCCTRRACARRRSRLSAAR